MRDSRMGSGNETRPARAAFCARALSRCAREQLEKHVISKRYVYVLKMADEHSVQSRGGGDSAESKTLTSQAR